MQKPIIKVICHEVYRDGGTVVYIDELNRLYYTYKFNTTSSNTYRKVYNEFPYRRGDIIPAAWVKEVPVELEIVNNFNLS